MHDNSMNTQTKTPDKIDYKHININIINYFQNLLNE